MTAYKEPAEAATAIESSYLILASIQNAHEKRRKKKKIVSSQRSHVIENFLHRTLS